MHTYTHTYKPNVVYFPGIAKHGENPRELEQRCIICNV